MSVFLVQVCTRANPTWRLWGSKFYPTREAADVLCENIRKDRRLARVVEFYPECLMSVADPRQFPIGDSTRG